LPQEDPPFDERAADLDVGLPDGDTGDIRDGESLQRSAGSSVLTPNVHRSAARRVCTWTRPDEKRPNSTS
jgi:hypothetical protein